MKNLFTILSIIASTTLFAQTEFAPLGAKWTYYTNTFIGNSGGFEQLTKFTCVNSYNNNGLQIKVVNSEITKQSVSYNFNVNGYQYSNRTTVNNVDSFYELNDTVFVYNKYMGKFTQLYRFNVQEGEVVTQPIYDTTFTNYVNRTFSELVTNNDDSFSYKIDSIRMVSYNGGSIETFYTSPIYAIDWANADYPNGIFDFEYKTFRPIVNWISNEKLIKTINPIASGWVDSPKVILPIGGYLKQIGGIGSGLLPLSKIIHNGRIADGFQYPFARLTCYEDSTVNYNFNAGPCDSLAINSPLSLNSISVVNNIKIFPNPVLDNELTIQLEKEFSRGTKLHILDILGKEVLNSIDLSNQIQKTIDVSSLHAGVYFLVFESEGQRYYQKFQKL